MCKECGAGEIPSSTKTSKPDKPLVIKLGSAYEALAEAEELLQRDLAETESRLFPPEEDLDDEGLSQVIGISNPHGEIESDLVFPIKA